MSALGAYLLKLHNNQKTRRKTTINKRIQADDGQVESSRRAVQRVFRLILYIHTKGKAQTVFFIDEGPFVNIVQELSTTDRFVFVFVFVLSGGKLQ